MVTLDGGIVLGVLGDRLVTHRRATIGGRIIAWEDPCQARPDMTHAGTRGLVLEQVRVATGSRHACIHVDAENDLGIIEAEVRVQHRWGYNFIGRGRGATIPDAEWAALLDALHRAGARG